MALKAQSSRFVLFSVDHEHLGAGGSRRVQPRFWLLSLNCGSCYTSLPLLFVCATIAYQCKKLFFFSRNVSQGSLTCLKHSDDWSLFLVFFFFFLLQEKRAARSRTSFPLSATVSTVSGLSGSKVTGWVPTIYMYSITEYKLLYFLIIMDTSLKQTKRFYLKKKTTSIFTIIFSLL